MSTERLVATNIRWLEQAEALVARLDDGQYEAQRIGCHVRHILEFYECLLEGLHTGMVDYDARHRDATLEQSRMAAAARIGSLKASLLATARINGETSLQVRMEDASAADPLLPSTVGRELQALSSHTVHHFAIVAYALQGIGIAIDPDFGVAPSTLRYRASLQEAA